jgi:four helix bundle protein
MTENELKIRFKAFAIRVLKPCGALPNSPVGRAISGQLTRAGTSPGANYRAACRAKSRADFINKLAIVEEEIDESGYWLELIIEGAILKPSLIQPLLTEADELTRIVTASRITSKRNWKSEIANAVCRPVNRKSKMEN